MLNWLLGSKPPSWRELDEIFSDYRCVSVYVNKKDGIISSIKVSDVEQFYSSASVLVQPKYLRILRPIFIKFPNYVIIPTLSENIYKNLIIKNKWRGFSQYVDNEFVGGWLLYECYEAECREKQYLHLQISEDRHSEREVIEYHIAIETNNISKAHEVLFRSQNSLPNY
ncbi:MAG: hypothetical protein QXV69_05470 [Sulfolobaceae archaeon]